MSHNYISRLQSPRVTKYILTLNSFLCPPCPCILSKDHFTSTAELLSYFVVYEKKKKRVRTISMGYISVGSLCP